MGLFKKDTVETQWEETLSVADLIAMYNYADKKMKASISNQAVWQRWVNRKQHIQVLIDAYFVILDDEMRED
jgi:hypothetical protein